MSDLPAYRVLDAQGVREFLAGLPLRERLGGAAEAWTVREVGDGNLNLVFIISGPAGSLCVKQALPYVRAAGPSWPMSLERASFENHYFCAVAPHVGRLIPEIFHYDGELYCTVMECLTPHIIARQGLIAGQQYPNLARDVGEFVARASYFTSDLAVPFEEKLAGMARFAANTPLLRISVDLIFKDPYRESPRNRHTSPQLDGAVAALRANAAVRLAAARMSFKFLTSPQALVHGDLHSGSVMVTTHDTRVIDPEFAFYGPIGFDLGAFFANLLLSWYSQPGYASAADDRRAMQDWLLQQAAQFWHTFQRNFLELWAGNPTGDVRAAGSFATAAEAALLHTARANFMHALFTDMIGFAACKMIRRLVGFAHVADFEQIADPNLRAACEVRALDFAQQLLMHPSRFSSLEAVLAAVPGV